MSFKTWTFNEPLYVNKFGITVHVNKGENHGIRYYRFIIKAKPKN